MWYFVLSKLMRNMSSYFCAFKLLRNITICDVCVHELWEIWYLVIFVCSKLITKYIFWCLCIQNPYKIWHCVMFVWSKLVRNIFFSCDICVPIKKKYNFLVMFVSSKLIRHFVLVSPFQQVWLEALKPLLKNVYDKRSINTISKHM